MLLFCRSIEELPDSATTIGNSLLDPGRGMIGEPLNHFLDTISGRSCFAGADEFRARLCGCNENAGRLWHIRKVCRLVVALADDLIAEVLRQRPGTDKKVMHANPLAAYIYGRFPVVFGVASRLNPLTSINRRAHHCPDQIPIGFHAALHFANTPEICQGN